MSDGTLWRHLARLLNVLETTLLYVATLQVLHRCGGFKVLMLAAIMQRLSGQEQAPIKKKKMKFIWLMSAIRHMGIASDVGEQTDYFCHCKNQGRFSQCRQILLPTKALGSNISLLIEFMAGPALPSHPELVTRTDIFVD